MQCIMQNKIAKRFCKFFYKKFSEKNFDHFIGNNLYNYFYWMFFYHNFYLQAIPKFKNSIFVQTGFQNIRDELKPMRMQLVNTFKPDGSLEILINLFFEEENNFLKG